METKKLNLNELQEIEGNGIMGLIFFTTCMYSAFDYYSRRWGPMGFSRDFIASMSYDTCEEFLYYPM